jgi:RHS repeat-associated protein
VKNSTGTTIEKNIFDSGSRKIATTANGVTTIYLYDGWNCIAEYSGTTLAKTRLWGTDLSGSMQGAGGVGGMLSESSQITSNPITFNSSYPTYDGNGNVSEYLNSTGQVTAHFEYDPFGNTVVNTDTSNQFAYRFSTKPIAFATGLYYYGYRYYDPLTGRWPSRDPIGELGGVNLYGFVGNDGVNSWDVLGKQIGLPGGGVQGDIGTPTGIGVAICKLLEFKVKQKLGLNPNDKQFHCVTSCEMAKAGGEKLAQAAGNLKECYAGQGSEADSAQDQTANAAGRGCAGAKDCKCCCKDAGY